MNAVGELIIITSFSFICLIAFAVDDVLAMASSLDQSAEILINLPEATFALLLVYKVLGRLVDALLP